MRHIKLALPIVSVVSTILTIQISRTHAAGYSSAPGPQKAAVPATKPIAQAAVVVKIENFQFEPRDLQIPIGTAVTWQNADDVPHTATSKDDPQVFDSGPLDTDEKFSFTFTKPGKFTYYCKVHPHMTGVVTVK